MLRALPCGVASPQSIGSGGLVLARARGLEIVADKTYLLSVIALTVFVGIPVSDHVFPAGDASSLFLSVAVALACSSFIVLHELAHTVVARHLGHRVRRITLFSLGGVSHVEGRASAPGSEYMVALAGPLMSIVLAAPLMLTGRMMDGSRWESLFLALGLVNFFLGAFNLIPAFPMDGGRILRSGLWAMLRDRARATRAAANVGRTFAVGVIALGVISIVTGLRANDGSLLNGAWQVMLGTFLYGAAGNEAKVDRDADASDAGSVR